MTSALANITESINKAASLTEAKQIFIDYVATSAIPRTTAHKIYSQLEDVRSLQQLQVYFYNSLLLFEGHGVR
jgi:thiamine monophosphate synthase